MIAGNFTEMRALKNYESYQNNENHTLEFCGELREITSFAV
jgi:hypothetical protein